MKKKTFRWIKIILIVYCLVGCLLYYLQNKLLLHPEKVATDSTYHFDQPFIETNISLDSGTLFNIVRFTVPDTLKKGVVLYFHGNQKNIARYAPYASWFTRNGYEVWMVDYPGFGKSKGALTEKIAYEEAIQVYKLARTQYQPSSIIIYGKSFGTGIAAYLASVHDCKQLVLETPYYSIASLLRPFLFMYPLDLLLHFKLPTYSYLPKVTAPIAIFHGTSDGVIRYGNASRLKQVLKTGDSFVTIQGGSHNDLGNFPLMQQKLDSILNNH